MGKRGREAEAGDRGDSCNKEGLRGLMSTQSPGMPSQMASEIAEAQKSPKVGWHGNVKR